jgi:cobalt-zinc-cadmium efflux system membrane fusion protein
MNRLKLTIIVLIAVAVGVLAGLWVGGKTSRGGEEPRDKEHVGAEGPKEGKAAPKEEAGHKEEEGGHEGAGGPIALTPDELKAAGIKVTALSRAPIADQVVLTAVIRPNQDRIAHIAPRVPARITKVTANLGDRVRTGQSLALLDSIELGEAHSAYAQAKSQLDLAESDFKRAEKLKADDIIPEKDFLRVRADYEKSKAALQAAADKLRLLDVPHQQNLGPNSMFPAMAPFSGTVIEKDAVLGELAEPSKSIFTIADLSTLWIEANLFEKDLGRLKIGSAARVSVSAYPDETFPGRLTYISNTLDKESRAVLARVEVANKDGRLKPEMFATVSIDSQVSADLLVLPMDAIFLVNGQSAVFIRQGEGFVSRNVSLGDKTGGLVVVKDGVQEGDQIVVVGAYALKARMLKSQIGDAH